MRSADNVVFGDGRGLWVAAHHLGSTISVKDMMASLFFVVENDSLNVNTYIIYK